MLPRIPLVEDVRDFWKFSKAGRALAELHINYESVPPYEGVQVTGESSGFFTVEKMRYPKKGQTDTIIYNSKILITNIPAKAYGYVVNGKSAIDWIMERYAITINKDSGIKNDPNDWAKEVGNPRYILDLLLSVINVSVQTVEIVNNLPRLQFDMGTEEKEFSELDFVISTAPIKNVPVGTIGTIVHEYGDDETFEVEFFQSHKTIAVETVSKSQIQKRVVNENA